MRCCEQSDHESQPLTHAIKQIANRAPTKKPRLSPTGAWYCVADDLGQLHLVSLHALLTLDGDEGDLLAFLQGLEAAALDRAEMHEQVRAAFRGDKAKALGVVEPFDCTVLTIRHF